MGILRELQDTPNGARFHRVDLHVHSYGKTGSQCVKDERMTPAAIVAAADKSGVSLVSITDHNCISNVEEALTAAEGRCVVVLPGVELTTTQGHLLVYAETLDQLARIYGKLDFNADRTACANAITDCLRVASEFDGFAIAAHIHTEAGFEERVSGYDHAKRMIVTDPMLMGLEVADPQFLAWFSSNDSLEARRDLFRTRCETLKTHADYVWPSMMFSDAHTMDAFVDAANGSRITRMKMDNPSFSAVRIALADASSRVRVEDTIPKRFPRIVGVKTEGGFLGSQTIHFNRNLNTIIGGRGAGKSTLLESLRVGAGCQTSSRLVDSEAWPDLITVIYEDETGRIHVLERRRGDSELRISSEGTTTLSAVPIESYGQGETSTLIHNCRDDPSQLLAFLDEFTEVDELLGQDQEFRAQLERNAEAIESSEEIVKNLPTVTELFNDTRQKLETLKAEKAGQLVQLEQALADGRKYRADLVDRLNLFLTSVREALSDRCVSRSLDVLEPVELVAGADQLTNIKSILDQLDSTLASVSAKWDEESKSHIESMKGELAAWRSAEAELEQRIEDKRRELQAKGIPLDAKYIRDLTTRLANCRSRIAEMNEEKSRLTELRQVRRDKVSERKKLRSRISTQRQAWADRIVSELKGTVSEYEISIKFREGRLSGETAEFVKTLASWRTSQVPRARLVSEAYTPFELLDIVARKDSDALAKITTPQGEQALSSQDISTLLEGLASRKNARRLEAIAYEDLPEIRVTKLVDQNGKRKPVVREFGKLSLGQQQAVLLSILLFSRSRVPLVIDQPEDNLDNEFIYHTIVGNLKRVKEQRQVIVVTHNANLAVLGDSELLIPLKATSDRAFVVDRGSIDSDPTRSMACDILEGSEEAFRRRQEIYNLTQS